MTTPIYDQTVAALGWDPVSHMALVKPKKPTYHEKKRRRKLATQVLRDAGLLLEGTK